MDSDEQIEQEAPDEPVVPHRVTSGPFDLVRERTVEPLWVIGLVIVLPLLVLLVIYLIRLVFGS